MRLFGPRTHGWAAYRRVEDGRGGLGHAATLRFPSPLIKPDVRICRVAQPLLAFAPQLGRIEARTGLRMMPTFPRSPRSFRTAGFPQYGWKAGLSGGAFPDRQRLKPAPGIRLLTAGLPSPFVHLRVGAVVPYCAGPLTCRCTALEGGSPSAPGALARVRVMLSRSVLA